MPIVTQNIKTLHNYPNIPSHIYHSSKPANMFKEIRKYFLRMQNVVKGGEFGRF